VPGRTALQCRDIHQPSVTPTHTVLPALQRQQGAALGRDARHQIGRPWIVLAPLGTHARVRGSELFGMRSDPAACIDVDGLEDSQHRPAHPETLGDRAVDLRNAGDAVADEAVRLPQQCTLQPIEQEALDLAFERHRHDAGPLEPGRSARRDVRSREVGRDDLDHIEEERWIQRVHHEASAAFRQVSRDLADGDRRGGRSEDCVGRCPSIQLLEQGPLEFEPLGSALLHVMSA